MSENYAIDPNYKKAYDMRPDEHPEQYNAFMYYINLGVDRSHKKVAEEMGLTWQRISSWARKFDWANRAFAYDTEFFQDVLEHKRKERILQQEEVLDNALIDYRGMLATWQEVFRDIDASIVNPKRLNELMRVRMQIEDLGRKATGMPASYIDKPNQEAINTDAISIEWEKPKIIQGKVKTDLPIHNLPQGEQSSEDVQRSDSSEGDTNISAQLNSDSVPLEPR